MNTAFIDMTVDRMTHFANASQGRYFTKKNTGGGGITRVIYKTEGCESRNLPYLAR